MRGIIIDKNFSEAFVCLEDGETISIPSSEVTDSNVGDMITLSNISIPTNYFACSVATLQVTSK